MLRVGIMADLCIAICTLDRAGLLDDALASLVADGGVEVLVVDNGSRDATQTVAARWAGRGPFGVRYVREPRAGLSAARNRAVRETAANYPRRGCLQQAPK